MDRISALARRRRIQNLEQWTIYAILAEALFLAIFPSVAATAVVFGVITWFLRSRIDKKYKMRSLPFDVPIGIFLLLGAVSVMLSSVRSFDLMYNYCSLVGTYALTYLIVGQTLREPAQVKLLAKALGLGAICVVLWGFFQFVFGVELADIKWTDPDVFPELRKRIFSTLENPNVLAGYLDVFICLALGLLSKVEHREQKIVLVVAIVLLALCLAMTYSRGAFIAIALVFAVYGVLRDWRVLILFVIVTAIVAFNDENFIDRILSAFTLGDSSKSVRIGIWVSTVAMISDHPFAGIGWGAYQFVYPQYNYYVADPHIVIYHAHNIYLNYAAEIGIVGALAFFWYFFGTMFLALGMSGKSSDKWFHERIEKAFADDSFLVELATMINEKLADFSDKVMDIFGKRKPLRLKPPRHRDSGLVHHEEMKWHGRKHNVQDEQETSAEKNISGEKISERVVKVDFAAVAAQKDDSKPSFFSLDALMNFDDELFLDGFKLGIGLAFLSMALNGFTDDLLFNIPSSMLMWMLGATAAALNLMKSSKS